MKFILITGHATEGKTTLAGKITERFGPKDYALATPLKELTMAMFELFDKEVPTEKEVIRPYFQKIGTEIGRHIFGEDIWCETLERRVKANHEDAAIVSDIRRLNERQYFVDRYPTLTIRIVNPEYKPNINSGHISETEIDTIPYDYRQIRTESHEELWRIIKAFLEE